MKSGPAVLIAALFCTSTLFAQNIAPNSSAFSRPPAGVNATAAPGVNATGLNAPASRSPGGNTLGLGTPTDPAGGVWSTMIEYQKLMNKEAREDRKLQRQDSKLESRLKEDKFQLEKKKIEQAKREAWERYEHARDAANNELAIGVASGAASIAAGTFSFSGKQSNAAAKAKIDATKSPLPKKNLLEK